jgi:hypothetical protein
MARQGVQGAARLLTGRLLSPGAVGDIRWPSFLFLDPCQGRRATHFWPECTPGRRLRGQTVRVEAVDRLGASAARYLAR